jgi:hypothetical protein
MSKASSHCAGVHGKSARLVLLAVMALACCLHTTNLLAAPTFVQRNYATPQSSTATVTVSYSAAETAGDLNVVVVGWNDTMATVQSVKDTAGNTYSLAIGPTSGTALRQSIYYAPNIVSGANTVTVTFSQPAALPDVRILEYKGVSAVDVTAGASGNSATTNSGAATTRVASELIVGANTVATTTRAAGSGFTSRVITVPDGDIAEDKVVSATGSNSATATLSSSGPWVMQMVTFSAASGPAPTVTSVSPSSGTTAGGTAVTITGTNFATGATVTFGGTAATGVTVVNSTTITATTPAGSAGAVTVTVTVNGQTGSLTSGFTYIAPPTVSSVSPSSGTTAGGTAVTITGTNFASGATVMFGGTAATGVTVVNSTTITATTPAGSAGAVTVTVTNTNGLSGSLASGFTYLAPPTVTSVSPSSGTMAGGTAVTITGTNFASGATVTFGGTAATGVTVVNSTTITATTPAGSAGAVTVTVTVSGQNGSLSGGYTYVVAPTVTSVSPNNGPAAGGTAVTITGTNFASGATVSFGGTAATAVSVVNSTTITATTPAGSAGAVTVKVTVNSQSGSLTNGFTYVVAPTVTGVSPSSGTTAGGTTITITGTNFTAGATVTVGGTAATGVTVVNSTTITATTPAGDAGAVTVTVTNPGSQSGSLANGYTYVIVPTVTSVSPNNGSTAGGTAVTITGTNFAAGATVTFGGTAATGVAVVNSTTITATTPAHAAGAVTITVTVNGQSGSLSNGFTYNGTVAISFVQVAAATPQSPTGTVSVTYPGAQTAGDLNVVVVGWNDTTSTVQSVKDSGGNNYSLAIGPTTGTPLRQSIYYAPNIVGGANTVTVTFSQAAAYPDVRILEYRGVNAVDVAAGASGSSTAANSGAATTTAANELIFGADIVATTTGAAGSGFTSRIITSPDGDIAEDKVVTTTGSNSATATLTSSGPWIMQMVAFAAVSGPPPTITSVSPNSGTTAGGTAVTIAGTNFAAGATVTFGSAAASNVIVVSGTQITATTPAGSAGAVMVTVSNPGGQSGGLASAFTYIAPPTVTSVSPSTGPAAGGTAVTITGTNFASGATVTFGGTAATNVAVTNSTTITATTPAHVAGVVTVTVTNSNGLSGSLASGFTYVVPPTVTGVSPSSGSTAGGTAVTVTGTNFVAGATVTFGGTAATGVTVVNSTTITATTPAGSVGAVTVTVTNPGSQSGSLANGYTYVIVPTVTSISPNNGPAAGGTAVTITGTNFATGATVTFGGTAATGVTVVNSTTITATTPAGSGTVTVTVTVNGQSGSLANGFTYNGTANFTLSASPAGLTVAPGSQGASTITSTLSNGFNSAVSLSASGMPSGTTVIFNPSTIPAPGGGNSTMTITVGSSTATGTYPITVTGNGGGIQQTTTVTLTVSTALISYVQGNSATPQAAQTSVPVKFNAAQFAGDLNVVAVGWNDSTATVSAVTDTAGNGYTLAVGPTTISGISSQSIYYAKNIAAAAAGANTVTITFSTAAQYPDIRILEYSGADQVNPVDVTAASSANSGTSSSGAVPTTSPIDLLFGANLVQSLTTGPGSGFTSRLLTAPDGDIAEDRMVTVTGSYGATAPLSSSSQWIMQMVAFRTPSGSTTPVVNLSTTSINFGSVMTGNSSSPQPVTLSNVGSASLTISSIAIFGEDTGDFAQTNNCGSALPPNGTCTIKVTFAPTTTGQRGSSVAITDNAPGSPQTITLLGTGTGFGVTPHAAVLTFNMTQQFTASGSVTWSVDGVVGGSSTTGTISNTGLYSPPNSIGTHTVTATTGQGQQASATVYISNYPGTYTHHNDNLRTGQNNNETVLTPANVNPIQFGKLFSYSIDGIAFASPLYVAGVTIPGSGSHNVVYVATENDSVYAFDADGLSSNPLWHVSFLKSGVTTVPCNDVGECGDIPTQIGITSTPVIDPTSGTIYVVAKTKEGTNYVQRLHALDITTGAEKFGGPVVLTASVSGTGVDSSGGKETFNSLRENQRTGLLLSNGMIYFAFGSHGDQSPWHGWVLGYNATTLQQVLAYNATPDGSFGGGGIWQSGGGLATDATGDIYFTTSNGDFDANTGGIDHGDSIVKLSTSGSVVDYFTPHDEAIQSSNNLDLGSAGPVLLVDQTSGPYPHLLISAGKNGTIYVINRDNMGHFNANNDNQIVQNLVGALPNGDAEVGNFNSPVYYNGYVYFAAVSDEVRAFQLSNGLLSIAPTSVSSSVYPLRGGALAISSNGNTNGILWAVQTNGTDPNNVNAAGTLFAYDADNLGDELYDSNESGSRDTMDHAAKFNVPLVANGKVFVASQSQLTAYGPLP